MVCRVDAEDNWGNKYFFEQDSCWGWVCASGFHPQRPAYIYEFEGAPSDVNYISIYTQYVDTVWIPLVVVGK